MRQAGVREGRLGTAKRAALSTRVPGLQLAPAAVVLAALGALVAGFGGAYGDLSGRAAGNLGQTQLERDLRGASATDLSRSYVLAARDILPEGATFDVVTGDRAAVSTPVTLFAARGYLQFQLLPRRLVPAEQAQWILCYGCDPAAFEQRFSVVWDAEPGLAIMRART